MSERMHSVAWVHPEDHVCNTDSVTKVMEPRVAAADT